LQPSVLEFVDLVPATAAKGAGRIGDAPAESVVLDLLDRAVPLGLLSPVGRRRADDGEQVRGRVGREVGGVDAAVVAQLGVEVPEAGSGGGDLLAGGQVGEPVIELVEGVVESGEPVALAFELGSEGGALGAGVTSDGGADGAGLLACEVP
jgi:hypothetical protein